MNKHLRWVFASAYVVVTLLLLAGVVKHSAWFLAGLEPLADDGFGWVLAFALDGALVVSTCTLVSYQLRRTHPPIIVQRAFWLFLLYSTVANLAHALAHNHLADWSQGVTWWYYFSSIIGAALLPTALAIMPHAAEAVLVADAPQVAPVSIPASEQVSSPLAAAPVVQTRWVTDPLTDAALMHYRTTVDSLTDSPLHQPVSNLSLSASTVGDTESDAPTNKVETPTPPRRSGKLPQQSEPRTVAELVQATGLNKSTVTRKLAALLDTGTVQKLAGYPARYIVRNAQLTKGAP